MIKNNKKKNNFWLAFPGTGSVSQRYGSADLDQYQNVTDLEHNRTDIFVVTYGSIYAGSGSDFTEVAIWHSREEKSSGFI